MIDAERLYHGGPAIEGRWLLPGTATGRSNTGTPPDLWLYLTPSYGLAVTYASDHDDPWVYEVDPSGPVEQDPGSVLRPGLSLRTAHRARIVRRVKPDRVMLSAARHAVAVANNWV